MFSMLSNSGENHSKICENSQAGLGFSLIYSRILPKVLSVLPGYEGTEKMFYFSNIINVE